MKATFVQTLVYFDEPQVVLLHVGKKTKVIAVAVERDGMDYPFFACKVYKRDWAKYIDGQVDLYYLFYKASKENYFFFDWNKIDRKSVKLIQASKDEVEDFNYWPDRGFFSYAHTESFLEQAEDSSSSQVFNIDGTWGAVDFSQFHGKLSDLYAIFYTHEKLQESDNKPDVIKKLKSSVIERLWHSGGSYTGFYKAFSKLFPTMEHLKIHRIQYASPGQIELRGDDAVFNEMLKSITEFNSDATEEAKKAYNYIDNVLKKEKLKKSAPSAKFSSQAQEEYIKKQSDLILEKLQIGSTEQIYDSCEQNTLVYAKFVLSIHRRFTGVCQFFGEGRVNVDE